MFSPLINPALNNLGTETAFAVLARATQLVQEGKDIINLGIGQPDFPTPPNIVEAAVRALRDGHHGYTEANGIPPLRESVSEYLYRRYQARVDMQRIVIVPGGKMTMFLAITQLAAPGKSVIYPDPCFPIYESLIRYSGATPLAYPLRESCNFAPQADDILDQLREDTALIVVNTPGNPCGGVMTKTEMDKLLVGIHAHPHAILLADEIYDRIIFPPHQHHSFLSYPDLHERLILLNGWSKTFSMTGWRIGFAIWPQALIANTIRLCVNIHSCVNTPTQYAAIEALQGSQDAPDAMTRAFAERGVLITHALNHISGVRCAQPGGSFFAFANIQDSGKSAAELQKSLLEDYGVATIAGTSFGQAGEGYLRFSFANSSDNIKKAMQRLSQCMEDLCKN